MESYPDDDPLFPWNQAIEMTYDDVGARAVCLCLNHISARIAEVAQLLKSRDEEEIDKLKLQIAEWEDYADNAENPHPDEEHCTCAGVLQKRVKDLREELEQVKNERDWHIKAGDVDQQLLISETRRRQLLSVVLEDLVDGLDANTDGRCGLSEEEWNRRVAMARDTLDEIEREVCEEQQGGDSTDC